MKNPLRSIKLYSLIIITIGLATACRQVDKPALEFPGLKGITLTGGVWYDAMQADHEWLAGIDPERLLHHFYKVSGAEPTAPEYGGWEMEWRELRGHSIGHYLSAASRMVLLTQDSLLLGNIYRVITGLALCQSRNGNGYVSAFPEEYLDRVEAMKQVWAPYYTLHKILAGLVDGYVYLGNQVSLEVALKLTHYLHARIMPLGREQFQEVLDKTEQGGMNEVFWDLYSLTGDDASKELALAFYQESYFEPMLQREDRLKGFHSNSLIPNVVGLAREYELTGDVSRKQISEWFWNQMHHERTYVTGGTSNGEHWNSEPGHLETELGAAAHETCCTYNLIKLSNRIWSWDPDVKYQDYMERALVNGILAAQNHETGMPMYYVSMAPGYYKTWSTPDSSFWCCTGTGMEHYVRMAEYLYAMKDDRIYVNQFASSTLSFFNQDIALVQETTLPAGNQVSLRFETGSSRFIRLAVRIPAWTGHDYEVTLNGKPLDTRASPGSYLMIDRTWKKSDRLEIRFKPQLWYSLLPVKNDHVAIGYGPVVLAATFGDAKIEPKLRQRYGPYDGTPAPVPVVAFNTGNFKDYVEITDPGKLLFRMKDSEGNTIELKPFYEVLNEYYTIYLPITADATKSETITVDPSQHI